MFTYSEENYLKTIYHLEIKYPRGVSTNSLAEKMESKPSSVTEMVKKLSDKEMVNYRPYQGVKLSKKGKESAIAVIRKHRLWEYFLVEKMNFSWDQVHEVAEQLEHIKSDKLIIELDKFLGFPKEDPHGDPIPDASGKIAKRDHMLLFEIATEEKCICIGVKDSTPAFLRYLDKNSISLGSEITVLEKEEFDRSLKIKIESEIIVISEAIAQNLYVQVKN